jgi:hypothetical protein
VLLQNEHLTGTSDGIHARIADDLKQEQEALSRRDDALEGARAAEKRLDVIINEVANMLQTRAHVEDILPKIKHAEDHLAQLEQETATSEQFVAPARWALGILAKHPDLLRKHRTQILQLLDQPAAEQPYTDEIGQRIIHLMIDEVRKFKGLVSKYTVQATTLAADNLKFRLESIIKPFLQDPKQLPLEQRRLLIGALIDSGLTKDNLEQFRSELSIPWRKCPTHKEIDLRANLATLKFECTYPGCPYAE